MQHSNDKSLLLLNYNFDSNINNWKKPCTYRRLIALLIFLPVSIYIFATLRPNAITDLLHNWQAADTRPSTAVPQNVTDKLKLAAQFAALSSYCSSVDPPGPCARDWNRCVHDLASSSPADPSNRTAIMHPALTLDSLIIRKFSSYKSHWHVGGEGSVLFHPASRTIYVSFKGSTAAIDWVNDFRAWTVRFNPLNLLNETLSDRLRVHHGIQDIYIHIRRHAFEALAVALQLYPDCSVSITGHSLGGALGLLLATELRILQRLRSSVSSMASHVPRIPPQTQIDLITFGEPRVGNAEFMDLFSDITQAMDVPPKSAVGITLLSNSLPMAANLKELRVYRVANRVDIVPHLPPVFLGYKHWKPFYRIIETDNHGYAKVAFCSNGDYDLHDDDDFVADGRDVPVECRFTGISTHGHVRYFWDFSMVKSACFSMQ
jgi:hypothetical protein